MRIIRLKEVLKDTGLARSTIYKYVALGLFPKPVALGVRAVGWLESEVQDWIRSRLNETRLILPTNSGHVPKRPVLPQTPPG